MVSSYKGTENNEQEQEMILVTHTQAGKFEHIVYGVFREECSAIDPNLIHFIGEAKQDEN